MSFWIAGAVVGSALIGAGASSNAANTAANANQNATNAQLSMFNTTNTQQAPWRQAGGNALAAINTGFGVDASGNPVAAGTNTGGIGAGQFNQQFTNADLNSQLAPNYQFQLQQGLGQAQNMMAGSGGAMGGNMAQGLENYAQNYAGNAYQNAFNNYQTQQSNIFNRLSTIAGMGSASANQSSATGATTGLGVANTMVGQGNAMAAGQIGVANALTGGANNAMGWYQLSNLMNQPQSNANLYNTTVAGNLAEANLPSSDPYGG